ncbi:precorrin-3B synthase [Pseudaminobacter sp. 19-2017]|uniref:Precorrin-3B synthase n=1 Tax=Pseudaminobacter soli (ex Zhang et al. 2022) TaxID=2831468 RepID=A0A942DY65_9HYPH|nr:precorrin-3B synthase [Pseudaminobacter soli]MBS3649267.1 precorrin-3B synthase [Pseudaminobacter soli]
MNTPTRRGACPALSAPMLTGDGLLIRLSPASGGVSPKQLIGLCESASAHGNGIVEVTARGSFQFRGFSDDSARRFAEDVETLGVEVRTGVPIDASPLSGLDPVEIAHPRSLVRRIAAGIAAAGLTERLGPKVSVVVDGGGSISLDEILADVRLTAAPQAGCWDVAIAGDARRATPLGRFGEDEAVSAALEVLAAIASRGLEGRARDLLAEDLPRIHSFAPRRDIRGAQEFTPLPLTDGRIALPLALAFGHAESAKLASLATAAQAHGVADIRPAPDRTLLVLCPSQDAANGMRETAAGLGFVTDANDIRRTIAACPGAPACASGKIAAREIAHELAAVAAETGPAGTSIHISGCAKGCARTPAADITVVGGENGVGLVVNGTPRAEPLAYRTADRLAPAIAEVAANLHARSPGFESPELRHALAALWRSERPQTESRQGTE